MNELKRIISENSGISIGLVISLMVLTAWIKGVSAKADATDLTADVLQKKVEVLQNQRTDDRVIIERIDTNVQSLMKRR